MVENQEENKEHNTEKLSFINKIQLISMRLITKLVQKFGRKNTYKIASLFAMLVWHLSKSRRGLATNNIRTHLKTTRENAEKIAKQSFKENFYAFSEILFTQTSSFHNQDMSVHLATPDFYQAFSQSDRPIVGITGHVGAWEFLGALFAEMRPAEAPRMIVARKYNNPGVQQFIVEQRSSTGIEVLGHRSVVMPVLRALRKKGTVAFLADHRPTRKEEAIFLPFLGESTPVNMGPALLAVRAKALVWPMFLNREKDFSFTFHVYEPFDTATLEGTQEEKIRITAMYYTKIMEEHITKFPDQWFWMHNRWKPYPIYKKKITETKSN